MIELIQQRLDRYKTTNPVEEEQAIKEILQEIALYSLWQAGFFEVAAFQGGTSLRILHGLTRFSEDLDFILKTPDLNFDWNIYLEKLLSGLEAFGLRSEAVNKSRMDQRVKKAATINWTKAIEDVARFINPAEQPSLQLWSERFFRNKIERLG
jgi:predicted nucleotidyltransferase component of viral defense system